MANPKMNKCVLLFPRSTFESLYNINFVAKLVLKEKIK